MHCFDGLECVLKVGNESLLRGFVSTDSEAIRDITVKGAIFAGAVLEEHLHEVVEVDSKARRALIEGFGETADDHDAVGLAVIVAQV